MLNRLLTLASCPGSLLAVALIMVNIVGSAEASGSTAVQSQRPPPCAPASEGFGKDEPPRGTAVAIGGALAYDNAAVWGRLVSLAGGKDAAFVVFPTAAGNPEKSAQSIIEALEKYGAKAQMIPVAPKLSLPKVADAVRDAALIAKVKAANGVYFSGGDQARIVESLYDATGKPTPMLEAIWDVYRKGGVVAGSSAGAAIMSSSMFRDVPDVFTALAGGPSGFRKGKEIDRGLGFVGSRVFIDQHFLKRGRIGRMLPAMVALQYQLGLGVEENSAAIFCGDDVEIIGARGALLVDLNDAGFTPIKTNGTSHFQMRGAKLTYLDRGDRINLKTQVVTVPASKLSSPLLPLSNRFKPYHDKVPFYADILGDNTIVQAMSVLLDSPAKTATGLAIPSNAAEKVAAPTISKIAFEFKLYKAPDTTGYFSSSSGGEDYTVLNMRLDVTPVQLSQPLYSHIDNSSAPPQLQVK